MKSTGFHALVLHGLLLFLGFSPLHADIQNHGGERPRNKIPQNTQASAIQLVPKVIVEVPRGGSVDIPITAVPYRAGSTCVKILIPPNHGSLIQIDGDSGKAAVFRYVHDRGFSEEEETFTYLVTDSQLNPSGTRQTGRILIRNPHATLVFSPEEKLDFGKVPIGETFSKTLTLSNSFGSTVSGLLRAGPPWHVDDDPEVVLREGDARTFTISFSPKAEGEESSRISFDPDTVSLPELILHGSGQAPFVLTSPPLLKLSKDSPKSSVTLSNSTDRAITVSWRGDSSALDLSPPVTIPPRGGAEAWIFSRAEVPPDSTAKRLLTLCSSAYSLPVRVEVSGSKGGLFLELLRGGEALMTRVGTTLRLEGIARNTSESERTAELCIQSGDQTNSTSTIVLPPKTPVNFHSDWTPMTPGTHEIKVELREKGRLLDSGSWHVISGAPSAPPPSRPLPPQKPKGQDPVDNRPRIADEATTRLLVADVTPIFIPGWIIDRVDLQWVYAGNNHSGFRIQILRNRNALEDRTGEHSSEEWSDVKTAKITPIGGGRWSATLPFLMPGEHTLRVFPMTGSDVMVNTVTFEVTPRMVYWHPIKALLLVILIILIIRELRRRL